MTSAYRSPFDKWDVHASVRSMALQGGWPRESPGDWFTAGPGCVADHPDVAASGLRPAVLASLLLAYLDFTVRLASECFSPVCVDLALRRLDAVYEDAVALDAQRVQCDEAFHALMCGALAGHVAGSTGLREARFPEHLFFRRVRELGWERGPLGPAQYAFCVAVVSETIITDSLQKEWRSAGLRPEVRDVLQHHYRDEVRHSAFFSQALALVWPQWPAAARAAMAPLWPQLVRAFVQVDEDMSVAALVLAGFSAEDARRITTQTLAPLDTAERGASFTLTLRALGRAGVLEDGPGLPGGGYPQRVKEAVG